MKVDLPPLEKFPKSHIITFRYYSGVLHFMEEDYNAAFENLTKAFEGCHKASHRNKELILMYLIPAQFIVTRKNPSNKIWKEFPVLAYLYQDLFNALFKGDISTFNSVVLERRRVFVIKYLYLSIERIQALVYTRLFKQVYLVMNKPTRLSIKLLSEAIKFSAKVIPPTGSSSSTITDIENDSEIKEKEKDNNDNNKSKNETKSETDLNKIIGQPDQLILLQDTSSDQVECYLTDMIYSGRMKGYISRERQTLVLSSKDAFPKQVKN